MVPSTQTVHNTSAWTHMHSYQVKMWLRVRKMKVTVMRSKAPCILLGLLCLLNLEENTDFVERSRAITRGPTRSRSPKTCPLHVGCNFSICRSTARLSQPLYRSEISSKKQKPRIPAELVLQGSKRSQDGCVLSARLHGAQQLRSPKPFYLRSPQNCCAKQCTINSSGSDRDRTQDVLDSSSLFQEVVFPTFSTVTLRTTKEKGVL